jgi:hypothetical protein
MDKIFAFGEERKVHIGNGYYAFNIPASFSPSGKRFTMLVHRWNWMQAFGEIPKGMHIHHIDENKLNNSLDNLEMISASDHKRLHNCGNKNNFKGGCVSWHKAAQKWLARVFLDGKEKHLGCFLSQHQAYQALFDFHPEFWTPEKREELLTQCG